MSGFPDNGFDVLGLDPQYDGSCPCATAVIDGVTLEFHCWRVCGLCLFAGVHFKGAEGRAMAERVLPLLNGMEWSEWEMREGFRRVVPMSPEP